MCSSDARRAIVDAVGISATVPGGSLMVVPMDNQDPEVDLGYGDAVVQVNPSCQAISDEVTSLGITAGENGTVITIDGRDYRVLSIRHYFSGFDELELGAV